MFGFWVVYTYADFCLSGYCCCFLDCGLVYGAFCWCCLDVICLQGCVGNLWALKLFVCSFWFGIWFVIVACDFGWIVVFALFLWFDACLFICWVYVVCCFCVFDLVGGQRLWLL